MFAISMYNPQQMVNEGNDNAEFDLARKVQCATMHVAYCILTIHLMVGLNKQNYIMFVTKRIDKTTLRIQLCKMLCLQLLQLKKRIKT